MNTSSLGTTIINSIHTIGWFWFIIMVLIDIFLYKIHPIIGFLGTLFLFFWMTGIIH